LPSGLNKVHIIGNYACCVSVICALKLEPHGTDTDTDNDTDIRDAPIV